MMLRGQLDTKEMAFLAVLFTFTCAVACAGLTESVASVDVFDARPLLTIDRASFYEAMHLLTAVQAVVNR